MDEEILKYQVEVYLYDLSKGAAKEATPQVIGRGLEGVWHSAVVAYGREYSFTKNGVVSIIPGGSVLGEPQKIESLGETQLPYSVFLDYILSIGDTKFKPHTWDLLRFNSNHFSDEICQFLCGHGLPKFVLDLPQEITDTSFWSTICKEADILTTKSPISSGVTLGLIRSRSLSSTSPDNFIPRVIRDNSPELDQLQAQIEALRADQLSLEERRNALNLKEDKKKKKKDKEEKKDKKGKKSKKKQFSEEYSPNSSFATRLLHKSASCDTKLDPGSGSDESKSGPASQTSDICDINSAATAAAADTTDTVAANENLSEHPAEQEETKQSVVKDRSCESRTDSSPTHSILSNHRSSDNPKSLSRNKSIKRVSFEEKPDIIEDSPEPCDILEKSDLASTATAIAEETELDLPPLEDIPSKKPNSSKNRSPTPPITMASAEEQIEIPTDVGADGEPVMPKKERKPHIKGITFREFDHVKDFEDLVRTIVTLCSSEEQERLREMEDWIVKNEGTWVLSEGFNVFLSNVFHRQEWPSDARVAMLRLLAYGAKEDDIVLILHMDRKDHSVMNYAQQFDRLPVKEQESLALLFCNLFETASASEWLMYISEWDAPGGGLPLSNIRVTTKVAVNALLGDTPNLVNYGSALMANLGDKEVKAVVFDDVCSELAMAILQFFQGKPAEEQVWRCMKALLKFCTIGSREVPQLVKMIGPEPSKFAGMSKRVDELVEPIMARLASVPMF